MQKRWFDFSKRGLAKSVSWFFLASGLGWSVLCVRAQAEDYLHLPSIDLVVPDQPRVGDSLSVPLEGASDGVRVPDQTTPEGWQLVEKKIVLLQSGKISVPSLVILDGQGQPVRRTNPVEFNVVSTLDQKAPGAQAPYDDVPPQSLQFPWLFFVFICLLSALGVGLIIFLLQRWSKNRKTATSRQSVDPEIKKSEDQILLEILERLQSEKIFLKGRHKEHAFLISHSMKAFLGKRYDFDAEESTTSELLLALRENFYLPEKDMDSFRVLFGGLDQTKFTDYVPRPEECEEWIMISRELVMRLRRPVFGGTNAV